MERELITDGNIADYAELLSINEIDGIMSGRYTGFGAYDEGTGYGLGIAIAEIAEENIFLRALFTRPGYRGRGVASSLLEHIADRPKDMMLPIVAVTDEKSVQNKKIDTGFLMKKGFKQVECDHKYIDARARSLSRREVEPEDDFELLTLQEVKPEEIMTFLMQSKENGISPFSDAVSDIESLAECSICARRKGKIIGALLAEEADDTIIVKLLKAEEEVVLARLLTVFKTMTELEFYSKARLRFLVKNEDERTVITSRLKKYEESPLLIFKME